MIRNNSRNDPKYFSIIFKLLLEIILPNFRNNSQNFYISFSKLYEICLELFFKNFKKIHFWIFIHMHFKLKLKNLWVTLPYKRNRSNTENIECRPVTSLLRTSPPCLLITLGWYSLLSHCFETAHWAAYSKETTCILEMELEIPFRLLPHAYCWCCDNSLLGEVSKLYHPAYGLDLALNNFYCTPP